MWVCGCDLTLEIFTDLVVAMVIVNQTYLLIRLDFILQYLFLWLITNHSLIFWFFYPPFLINTYSFVLLSSLLQISLYVKNKYPKCTEYIPSFIYLCALYRGCLIVWFIFSLDISKFCRCNDHFFGYLYYNLTRL